MEIKDIRNLTTKPTCGLCEKRIKDAGAVAVYAGERQYGIVIYVYYHVKCVKELIKDAV